MIERHTKFAVELIAMKAAIKHGIMISHANHTLP